MNVSILHTLTIKECDIWYMRFCLDYTQRILALGTITGKINIWDLNSNDPYNIK
jgi:polycomb protein EED